MKLIKKITAADTLTIRKQVLRNGMDLPCEFDGDLEENTFHLGVFNENKLVGIATFMQRNVDFLHGKQYQLRGMATLEEVRGKGFGNALLQNGFHELMLRETDYLWCNAREAAISFYQKNDFVIQGNSFEIETVGTHYKMFKKM